MCKTRVLMMVFLYHSSQPTQRTSHLLPMARQRTQMADGPGSAVSKCPLLTLSICLSCTCTHRARALVCAARCQRADTETLLLSLTVLGVVLGTIIGIATHSAGSCALSG